MDKKQKKKIRIRIGDLIDHNCKTCEIGGKSDMQKYCNTQCDVGKELLALGKQLEEEKKVPIIKNVVEKEPVKIPVKKERNKKKKGEEPEQENKLDNQIQQRIKFLESELERRTDENMTLSNENARHFNRIIQLDAEVENKKKALETARIALERYEEENRALREIVKLSVNLWV
ncbi:zinc-finger domain-containing protein [Bacillus litorisediminis]|uniref:zinc-finger domain-containing protein n=1 Tax=Bacillus litorisediminis TaxID=2922713 RepID=UPI001FAE481F|nr:zinc-finger domain-containing protein [Bacillus litorisediminis]